MPAPCDLRAVSSLLALCAALCAWAARMRKSFQEKGMSDEAIVGIEQQAFQQVKDAGRAEQRCVMASAALQRALKQESEGVYDPTSWHGCRPPPPKES
jgi:hypothetical protein